ncbi:MAG: hypothetical protein JO352_37650 [Chloroflexi bacterium]|nr:hypothetical protein [Chloroflexota bacterium]
MTTTNSRTQGQAFVEYALLAAVVVIAFLVGLSALSGAAVTYMAHTEPTPPAAVLNALPNHAVNFTFSCAFPSPPAQVLTGQSFTCTATVQDITTPGPAQLPTGNVVFSSPQGTFTACVLGGSGVTATCTSQFTPTERGAVDISATYAPTSSHLTTVIPPADVTSAVDQTQMVLRCPPSAVPVGEPAACTATVNDLYPSRAGPVANLPVTITAGTGTFSAQGQLSPQTPGSSTCTTTASGCTLLFRSNPVQGEAGVSHTLTATFPGDQNYAASTSSAVVSIGAVNPHPVSVSVTCSNGTQMSSPLLISSGESTTCTAKVQDASPPDGSNNPTRITPTGTVSWTSSADYGSGGFATNTCTLTKLDDETAQCPVGVTYTPTSIGDPPSPYLDTQHIVATYNTNNADPLHQQSISSPATNIYVTDQHPAEFRVNCTTTLASPIILGGASPSPAQCTVQVTDKVTGRPPITPTGSVTWTGPTGGPGFAGAITGSPCSLQPLNASTAQCAITYMPTAAGTTPVNAHQLTASYPGDTVHPGASTGVGSVYVANIHPANVQISCNPTPAVVLNLGGSPTTTTCTFSVKDPSPSPVVPTGSLSWSLTTANGTGGGDFNPPEPGPCVLQQLDAATAACATPVTYTPTSRGNPDGNPALGENTHVINVAYAGDTWHQPAGATSNVTVHQ